MKAKKTDFDSHKTISKESADFNLRPIELKLSRYFFAHPNKLIYCSELIEVLWGSFMTPGTVDALYVHMSRLKKKLAARFREKLIYTVPKVGYILRQENKAEK